MRKLLLNSLTPVGLLLLPPLAMAVTSEAPQPGSKDSDSRSASPTVKYRKGKDVDFEELLIQGQLKRPEISVVTGNAAQGTDGLLRLRENFLDQMAMDLGEEVK